MGQQFRVETEEQMRYLCEYIRLGWVRGKIPTLEVMDEDRSQPQNSALHVYCRLLAEKLNDAGLDMRHVIRQEVELPWSMYSVKEYLWRPVQKAITGKKSSAEPTKAEYPEIYEALNRMLVERCGIAGHVPWPNKHDKARQCYPEAANQ